MPTPVATPDANRQNSALMTKNNVIVDDVNNSPRHVSSVKNVIQLSEMDIKTLVLKLNEERHREESLRLLSNIASSRPLRAYDLAPVLWDTPRTVFILLKEVMTAYSILDKEDSLKFTVVRIVNAICLLQSIAMNAELRKLFVQGKGFPVLTAASRFAAQIPAYVYPFLRMRESSASVEKLRVASLGVVGALVKAYDSEVIHYLLDSEVFPCCLCSLEFGNQFAKTVVAFVISKLLSCKEGILYCCSVSERFLSVLQVFQKIVEQTSQFNDNSIKLFRYIVSSYFSFAVVPGACAYLRSYFPRRFSRFPFLAQLAKVEPKLYEDIMRLHNIINEEVVHLGLPTIGLSVETP